jgi:uncharacterized membrane protein YuzA (DUF378 family)
MNRYERTQRAFLLNWLLVPVVVGVIAALLFGGGPVWAWLLVIVVGAAAAWIVATFGMLTVIVDETRVRIYFGRGWPRRTVPLADVVSARAVRNSWWYGWGIRWFPGGTLWNVWGLDAVELELRAGRLLRIGTDDVEGLLGVLAR